MSASATISDSVPAQIPVEVRHRTGPLAEAGAISY